MISMNAPWYYREIKIGTNNRGDDIYVNTGDLYIAGMFKDDFRSYMMHGNLAEQTQLEVLREHAGKRFTELGISTAMATKLLLHHGTIAYAEGCREEWAVYANRKANTSRNGCLIIAAIIAVMLYYILK